MTSATIPNTSRLCCVELMQPSTLHGPIFAPSDAPQTIMGSDASPSRLSSMSALRERISQIPIGTGSAIPMKSITQPTPRSVMRLTRERAR